MRNLILTGILATSLGFLNSMQAQEQGQQNAEPGRVTLEECYAMAEKNYPMVRQYEIISKTEEYTLANAAKGWLPQITFSAKASWQSDVTKLPADLSKLGLNGIKIPQLDKDQYGATLEINQNIWDGGAISAEKKIAETQAESDKKSLDANIYAIRGRVNDVYFGIVLIKTRIEQNNIMLENLRTNYTKIESYIENGIGSKADLDAVRIQELKTLQDNENLQSSLKAYTDVLSILTGEKIGVDTDLVKPEPSRTMGGEVFRPELAMYDAQLKNIEMQDRKLTASVMPRFGLYVTGGYGRPGLNMLDDSFSPYMTAGIRLSWNISSFYTRKNSRRLLENNRNSVLAQKETFLFNTGMDIAQKSNEIENYENQLAYDDEIISLRESVLKANEARMAEGTISGTDLVNFMNDCLLARQDKDAHEINMLMAMYNLKYVTNN